LAGGLIKEEEEEDFNKSSVLEFFFRSLLRELSRKIGL
jgi:hypothetical protein